MKFKKIDREFLLSDSTVNSYGFRLLTSGYLMHEYEKNPIGYYMHERDKGVLIKWEDLRVEGDNVYGKPVINLSHERGEQTVEEIENGFLNAASVGHLMILEYTEDSGQKVEGQTGPTVTKWYNRECSIVDIPGNFNALALYDENENPLNLADFTKTKLPQMKQINVTAAMLSAMNLKADADDNTVTAAITDLLAKGSKYDALSTELADLKTSIEAERKTNNKAKVTDMLTAECTAGKITKEMSDKLAVAYESNPEGLKDLLDAIPTYKPVTEQISDKNKKVGEDLAGKSWDELFKSGKVADLKASNPELYKAKFKEKFGHEPTI